MIASQENFSKIVPTLSMFAMASYKLIPAFQQIYFYLSGIKFSQSAIDSISKDLQLFNSNKDAAILKKSEKLITKKQNVKKNKVNLRDNKLDKNFKKDNIKIKQKVADVCLIVNKCSIDEISKYLIDEYKNKPFPDITTRE